MGRMKIENDPDFSAQTPDVRNCSIEATTISGETRMAHCTLTAEDIEKGMADEEVEAKFIGLVQDILTPTQVRVTLDLLWRLDELDDAARVLDNLEA
jgi:hypothetical protein